MRKLSMAIAFATVFASIGGAMAQIYPSRAITIVVPLPPGGATDTLARTWQTICAGRSASP